MTTNKTSLEVIAPTVEEAIAKGAAELGYPAEELEVDILDEGGKGLFGISSRQARIRLTIREIQPEETVPSESAAAPQVEPVLSEEDELAVQITFDTVTELLKRMGIQANVNAKWGEIDEEGRIRPLLVDIRGDDLSVLIGRRGETLSALQYITRLIVAKELEGPVSVVIDVQGYRARREQQLRKLARRMADQAIELGRTMTLEPMPANERRIIHVELRNNPRVSTESIGERDKRKVTIVPK